MKPKLQVEQQFKCFKKSIEGLINSVFKVQWEIRLLFLFSYLFCGAEVGLTAHFLASRPRWQVDSCRRHYQVKSLARAAHLLNDNAGVLR